MYSFTLYRPKMFYLKLDSRRSWLHCGQWQTKLGTCSAIPYTPSRQMAVNPNLTLFNSNQREVNNRVTIAAIEANNDRYCLQNQIEKFPLFYLNHFGTGASFSVQFTTKICEIFYTQCKVKGFLRNKILFYKLG